jgi:hypothetical protein
MKKLNAKILVEEFNKTRIKNLNGQFTGKELDNLLYKYCGFQNSLTSVLKRNGIFEMSRGVGAQKLYRFVDTPLFVDKMDKFLQEWRNRGKRIPEQTQEEKSISFLKSQGYKIKVCRGFDIERFQRENPDLYQKYLIYEDA